jgi:hypothetical protein
VDDLDFPWPRLGDKPFREGDADTERTSWFVHTCLGPWRAYADSYKEVADLAVRNRQECAFEGVTAMYPVAFMYRHFMELQLKCIVRMGQILGNRPEDVPCHHRLMDLWTLARLELEIVWPTGDRDTLDAAQECIAEFERVDPRNTAFRYLTDLRGGLALKGVDTIDLDHLAQVMDRIGTFFSSVLDGMNMYFDALCEGQAESR